MRGVRFSQLFWRLGSGIWLGTIFFFFVGIAPNIFVLVPMPYSGRFVTHIFPLYYAIGLIAGGVAFLAGLALAWTSRRSGRWLLASITGLAWVLLWYAYDLLLRMQHLSPNSGPFQGMHQTSIVVNTIVMVILLVAYVIEALVA
ncbi:MAG: DUF4149 domain-containing protein [Sulfobacillus sp.]|nr:DUF4149 domain-containing protein [Sulfobacillus sp.]